MSETKFTPICRSGEGRGCMTRREIALFWIAAVFALSVFAYLLSMGGVPPPPEGF